MPARAGQGSLAGSASGRSGNADGNSNRWLGSPGRWRGGNAIGPGGDCSSAAVRSVADGVLEWEDKNRSALFVRDDECLVFYEFSKKESVARDLASAFLSLFSHRIQVLKVHALLITEHFCFVFDVEEIT